MRRQQVRRDDYEDALAENKALRQQLKDVQDQSYRSSQFWLCRHGWHRMDRATRQASLFTPGWDGVCRRCGVPLRKVLA